MADGTSPAVTQTSSAPPIIIQQMPPQPVWGRRWFVRTLMIALVFSLLYCVRLSSEYQQYFDDGSSPTERYHSGDKTAKDKLAVIEASGTIMPPFTGHLLDTIKKVNEDEQVKGVLLVIDSPGGLVADSHQIYQKLKKLSDKKPMYVAMKRIAASGGVYIAMGAGANGKIFAEPTTLPEDRRVQRLARSAPQTHRPRQSIVGPHPRRITATLRENRGRQSPEIG